MCLGYCQVLNVGKHFRLFDWVWRNRYLDCAPSILDKGDQTACNDPSLKATGMIALVWKVALQFPLSTGTFQWGMDMVIIGFLRKRMKINWRNRMQVLTGINISFHSAPCDQVQRLEGELCHFMTAPHPLFCTLWNIPKNCCGLTLTLWFFYWSF